MCYISFLFASSFVVKNNEGRIVACGMNCDAYCVPETKPKAKRLSYVFEVLEHVKGPARYRVYVTECDLSGRARRKSVGGCVCVCVFLAGVPFARRSDYLYSKQTESAHFGYRAMLKRATNPLGLPRLYANVCALECARFTHRDS